MLSVLIVNFKNPALLRLCLKSIAPLLPESIPSEVIVVDVATTIETQNVVREEFADAFNELRLISFKDNIGYTRGVNEAIRHSCGDVIFNINADIISTPGAIEQMYEYIRGHRDIGLMGPQLLNFDGSRQDSCFRFYTPLTVLYRRIAHLPLARAIIEPFLMHDVDLTKPTPADWLMGSALMARRDAIEKVGFMDERFFLYFSEVDWARRFWNNGYAVVYYPHARMYHYHQRQSKGGFGLLDVAMRRETRWHIMDGIRYFGKYGLKTSRPSAPLHGIA